MPDPDLEISGGRRGDGPGHQKFFWPFRPQFGLKIRGGAGSLGPPMDLPLLRLGGLPGFIHWKIVAALLKTQRFNQMEVYVDI